MQFTTVNPATGKTLKTYDEMSWESLDALLKEVAQTQREWRKTPFSERSRLMKRAAQILKDQKDALAELMAQEMGKPLDQGRAEIEKCAWVCEYYAENAEKFLQSETVKTEAHESFVAFKPLGVVLAIMPWNYPFWQVFRFAAPGLMAGNAGVLKHAPNVYGCALALEKIFQDAGFPPNLFRSLIIDIPATTKVIHHPQVAAVTITSSVRAGQAVATEAGKVLKKCVLELGGSDAFVVLEDADIDKATEIGITARYQNTGQSCIAAKRFIVVEAIREKFEKKFVERAKALTMGDPHEDGVKMGPMARTDLRDELHDQVQRSVAKGAKILTGGQVPDGPGAYYPPTVITDVKEGMAAWSEELFGPVAIVIPVKDENAAIQVANGTDFGLGGAVWTQDLERGKRIAADLMESGSCTVNGMTKSDPRLPFGGIKKSGYGRELSAFGIREFVNIHPVVVNQIS